MASETVSTLRELAFRGELTAELAKVAMDRFQAMQFETLAPERLWPTAWNVAESLGWARRKSEYVALAQSPTVLWSHLTRALLEALPGSSAYWAWPTTRFLVDGIVHEVLSRLVRYYFR